MKRLRAWKPKDPILRLKLFMEKKGLWNNQYQTDVESKAKGTVDEAVKREEAIEHPEPKDMFTFTYEKLTQRQMRQMKEL